MKKNLKTVPTSVIIDYSITIYNIKTTFLFFKKSLIYVLQSCFYLIDNAVKKVSHDPSEIILIC